MAKTREVRWVVGSDLGEGVADAWEAANEDGAAVQYEGRWWLIMGIQTQVRVGGGMVQMFKLVETRKPN